MATYVMADIHGEYDAYLKMLEKINFSDEDVLYILGDVIDRGPKPIKVLLDLMKRPNVICLIGNHELMGIVCLNFLMKEITDENIDNISERMVANILNWHENGSSTTLKEFHELDTDTRKTVYDFISEFEAYAEVTVNEKKYILVHAGLGAFSEDKMLWDYEIEELVWERPDYSKKYFDACYVVTGHTPTMNIVGNSKPGYIYRANNHIAIDCGACFGGRLACLCLDTDEEFYVEVEK